MKRNRIPALLGLILIILGFMIEFYGCILQQNDIILLFLGLWMWQGGILLLIGYIIKELNEQKKNDLILSRALNNLLLEDENDRNK